MRREIKLLGLMLVLSLMLPLAAFGLKAHPQPCTDCHRGAANPRLITNLCVNCHQEGAGGSATAPGEFAARLASNAMGHHPTPAILTSNGAQTSHFWAANTPNAANQPAAGATSPPSTFYYSRYGISTGRVTCSACHNPHFEKTTKLLRASLADDLICQNCHTGFYVDNSGAVLTHPVGSTADYAAALAAAPTKYNPAPPNNAAQGITLINGKVSCSSCHAVHFADSDSTTVDGTAASAGLHVGDGHLLKSDGPTRTNKSVLCQTCHTYQEHGKMSDGGESVGCMTCHSGHVYNGATPNYYVLRNSVTTSTFGARTITYTAANTSWNDNTVVTATGYCEVCHGSAETIPKTSGFHLVNAICRDCHLHQVGGGTYSFQNDASVATCGDCHGFPPYLASPGNRTTGGTDGGYAYTSSTHNYFADGTNYKTENTTPHNTHAAGGLVQGAATDAIFGGGTAACDPCHLNKSQESSHATATNPGSYRDIAWNDLATGRITNGSTAIMTPVYKTSSGGGQWGCTLVYCHSNGGKRPASGAAKVSGDFTFPATAPIWLNGKTTIVGKTTPTHECNFCHGNTAASMASVAGQKYNSNSHQKHLGTGTLLKTYSCNACHSQTATSSTALSTTPNARLVKDGGKHVNGTPDIIFNSSFNLGSGSLGTGTYNGGTQGTCTIYCHSNGKGSTVTTPDWDVPASGACGACHSTAGASLSAPHAKHLAIATVTCNDCHFTVSGDATLGTHTGHIDGAFTFSQAACNGCHGWESGETTPAWGQTMTNAYCRTCHTGLTVGVVKTMTAPTKQHAATRGHNRTTNYPSGNLPGNKICTDCHLTSITNHVNVTDGDATHLAAAATTCTTSCHGPSGSAVKDGIVTHVSKACTACHDPHGDTTQANIYMVRSASTGNYSGTVVFTTITNADSYDEDDGAPGNAGEVNADDLCATCHTYNGGATTGHNNKENQPTTNSHNQGADCFASCHLPHTEATGAFKAGAGNFCNDCHGNPPSPSDDRPAGKAGAHAAHVKVASNDASEDKFDCEVCHPGAASFGLSHAAVPLAAGISNTTCSNACHKSAAGDGSWTDSNGLDCNACHYWAAAPSSAGNVTASNSEAVSTTHNKHFDKTKLCVNCHANNAADAGSHPTGRVHIDDHEAWALNNTNDGTVLQDRGNATQDEATVDFTTATTKYGNWNDTANTCGVATANNGLGCHATGAPTWGAAGPLACVACHSNKTTSAVNPTSGLHGVTPLVSGKQHDESFTYNAGANTADCATCHTASPTVTVSDHQNGTLDATRGAAGNSRINFAVAVGYTDAVAPTCAPSLTGCHYEQPTKLVDWRRKWHEGATSNTGACAGCHGDWVNGWVTNVQHHTNAKAQSTHGTKGGKTWECMDCHGLESVTLTPYIFTIGSNDWRQNAGENTTLHGNGVINVNSNGTGFVRVGAIAGCPTCHTNWQTDGKHAYTKTEWTLTTISADAPTVTCATCHGGLTSGPNATNYWPDKAGNDGTEDNAGRHAIHMTRLAMARYNEDITALLTNNTAGNPGITADAKQKELCSYCHTTPGSDADHGDTVNLPAEVNAMFTLWSKAADNASYSAGNCSSVNCHNGKATATTATFDWYGAGTGNCVLCHNDITVTTAGTTGASHQAHIGAGAAVFGKAINCASCHGGSPTWSPYLVPSGTTHINGTFLISGGSVTLPTGYSGTYTDAATRTPGTCLTNPCHNNGTNGAPYNGGLGSYTWQTALPGCTACHRNDLNLGSSHNPHMNASFATTFGRAIVGCGECHDAVSGSDMSGKTAHMDGSVTLAGATYTGNLSVGTASYGLCSASVCHQNGKGANVNSPTWNRAPSSADNCTICHNNGSGAPQPATGRHAKHVANTAYVTSSCGSCHAGATATTIGGTTHINATANTGASINAHTAGAADCTNNCHVVNTARGDWNDADVLGCADCHVAGKIAATAGAMPTSGLHNVTPRISAKKHDATVHAQGCEYCHSGIRAATTTHIKGNWTVDGAANADRGLFAAWTEAATGSCLGSGVNLAAGCHRDNGKWGRKWAATTTNNDGSECVNCHGGIGAGYTSTTWNGGVVPDHLANWDGDGTSGEVMTGHSVCKSCHGFNNAADKDANYVLTNAWNQGGPDTSMHGNSQITLNGGTNYNAANWGCDNAGCHLAAASGHHLADSGWTVQLGAFAAGGSCFGCHGNGSNQYWPDGSTGHVANDNPGAHAEHVQAIADKMTIDAGTGPGTGTLNEKNQTCAYCHPGNTHGGADGVVPADVSRTDLNNDGSISGADPEQGTSMMKIVGGTADTGGFWRRTPGTCTNVACHANAPFTPHWYTDTVAPGNITLTAVTGPVPRSIKLTWTAVGDDGTDDGTAYKYDIRMGTTSAIATNFGLTTNYVQGVPTVKRMGEPQETIIHNVDPSTTYYFALRTYDRDVISNPGTTVYGTSNTASYTTPIAATLDNVAPVLTGSPQWYGLDTAKVLDTTGAVKMSWTRAEDHSMPITYDLWWGTGAITYGAPQASTKDTAYRVTGLSDGQTYNFAVRAKDAYSNTDTNTVTLQAIPQGLATVPKTSQVYYANGTATSNIPLQTATHTTNGTTATLPAVFIGPTAFTANTNIFANGFSINVDNANTAAAVLRAELGYITGVSTWNSFSTPLLATDQTVAKRAVRVITFKFNGAQRVMTGSWNAKLGVRISLVSGGPLDLIGWGPTSKGGILTFSSQPVNVSPTVPVVTFNPVSGANVSFYWTASQDIVDGVADTVHYDVYGSDNGGSSFPYVIATGLTTNATVGSPLVWDTQAAGIALAAVNGTVQVKVEAGDSINGKTLSHTPSVPTNLSVNNSGDNVAPGTIANFAAETRPKQGAVFLTWTAPGDDGTNNGRAASYDIRWSTAVIDNDTKFNAATQLVSEPYPDFGGQGQGYEALGLTAGSYYFAIKAVDNGAKTSPLAYTSSTTAAGPKCGICHSTPPDETETKGNHIQHGYTINDCANCHGNDPSTGAQTFATDHQDGVIRLGWKTASPASAIPDGAGYKYQQGGFDIYVDSDGSGGFNRTGDNSDDGSCGKWDNLLVGGCHGPAESVPWVAGQQLACSACHGTSGRTLDNYSHSFDDPSVDITAAPPIDNHGYTGGEALEGQRKYVGPHIAHLNYSFRMSKGDSCRLCHGSSRPGVSTHADGEIDIKLDLAAAGPDAYWLDGIEDPDPAVRTAGTCGSMSPDSCHPSTAAPKWDSAQTFACTNCHGFAGTTPSHVTDPNKLINLADNDADSGDPMPGNCTWCHIGGHPREKTVTAITRANPAVVTTASNHNLATNDKVTIHTQTGMTEINNRTYLVTVINATSFSLQGCNSTAYGVFTSGTWIEGNGTGIILLPNDSRVGIAYNSGGVHLKANIGARGEMSSEAELCWSCHVANSISEWGADSVPTNTATKDVAVGNGNYNFGTLSTGATTGNWIGATWTSGVTGTYGFAYKSGVIKSTHSTDPTGTAALTGTAYNYSNGGVDSVGKIHCSNCHDVHNSNKSPLAIDGLDPSGPPYLRGTWMSNPYKEDGAPIVGQTYTAATSGQPGYGYGTVPRASGSTTQAMGGYWIDQNSGNPTATWTYESSAGLCQLCHSKTVDTLDQVADTGGLWISATNGHANSVLGGSGSGAANIFYHGSGGRPGAGGGNVSPNPGVWMGFQINYTDSDDYGYGPRSGRTPNLSPTVADPKISVLTFAWGNAVDATTVEVGFHQFSCSKCHNPHASRLPKLMITNCLDVANNTWDDSYDTENGTKWTSFQTAASSWNTQKLSHLSTAQNCHRYIDINNDNTPDEKGWNKVTPWGTHD